MQIPRFFIDSDAINESASAARIDDSKLVHQIGRVLRLGVGAQVILLNGTGDLFHCRIENQDRDSVSFEIERKEQGTQDVQNRLTVAMPLIKPSRFEWALEKLTELGATTIIPIVTQRTVQKPNESFEDGKKKDRKGGNVKQDRWQAIVREAAEQSERLAIPKVVAPQNFSDFINDVKNQIKNSQLESPLIAKAHDESSSIESSSIESSSIEKSQVENAQERSKVYGADLHYILAERNDCPLLSMQLLQAKNNGGLGQNITLCFGPEGGFTDAEVKSAAEAGLTLASLGKLILRSETAAISAAAIVGALRNP